MGDAYGLVDVAPHKYHERLSHFAKPRVQVVWRCRVTSAPREGATKVATEVSHDEAVRFEHTLDFAEQSLQSRKLAPRTAGYQTGRDKGMDKVRG